MQDSGFGELHQYHGNFHRTETNSRQQKEIECSLEQYGRKYQHRDGYYRVFGETLDIGIGNMLDKLARYMGYPFPGGPAIEELSLKGKKLLSLPYSVMGMDTAFSGIYTAAINLLSSGESREDVAFSVQEHAFSMMVETMERKNVEEKVEVYEIMLYRCRILDLGNCISIMAISTGWKPTLVNRRK